jgi:hypothetical protein
MGSGCKQMLGAPQFLHRCSWAPKRIIALRPLGCLIRHCSHALYLMTSHFPSILLVGQEIATRKAGTHCKHHTNSNCHDLFRMSRDLRRHPDRRLLRRRNGDQRGVGARRRRLRPQEGSAGVGAGGRRLQASAAVRQTMSIVTENTKYGLRMANPRAADRPAGGWSPEGRVIMTP